MGECRLPYQCGLLNADPLPHLLRGRPGREDGRGRYRLALAVVERQADTAAPGLLLADAGAGGQLPARIAGASRISRT